MTGRTHDLAAFTALSYVVAVTPLPTMSLSTVLVALCANFVGGIAPDIDQPTANLWHRLPAGEIYGRLITPLLGGHRTISHSILGMAIFGIGLHFLLILMHHTLIVDTTIVWWAFMIGYGSHLVMDTFTHEGVPWLFPVPIKFGIPPIKALRIKTGGLIEKFIVFPGLIVLTGIIFYHYHSVFVILLRKLF